VITIIDSGISNIGSVLVALKHIGVRYTVTTEAAHVANARALLLPGVGAFADGMKALSRRGFIESIKTHAAKGKPLLGICLGMQLLADGSEEFGRHEGLGLIPGWVRRLPKKPGLRVPNIGWCDMHIKNKAKLFTGLEELAAFYFVHSYAMDCQNIAHSVGTINFGNQKVTVACQHGNIFGVQFHPEKSQDAGLTLLANFSALATTT
jgi:glutamine amidotransferase